MRLVTIFIGGNFIRSKLPFRKKIKYIIHLRRFNSGKLSKTCSRFRPTSLYTNSIKLATFLNQILLHSFMQFFSQKPIPILLGWNVSNLVGPTSLILLLVVFILQIRYSISLINWLIILLQIINFKPFVSKNQIYIITGIFFPNNQSRNGILIIWKSWFSQSVKLLLGKKEKDLKIEMEGTETLLVNSFLGALIGHS